MKRIKLSSGRSKGLFRKGVKKTVPVNISPRPMRGGIRL